METPDTGRPIKYNDFKKITIHDKMHSETLRLNAALVELLELDKDEYIIGNEKDNKVKIPKGTYIQIPNGLDIEILNWGEDVNIFNPFREFIDEELG